MYTYTYKHIDKSVIGTYIHRCTHISKHTNKDIHYRTRIRYYYTHINPSPSIHIYYASALQTHAQTSFVPVTVHESNSLLRSTRIELIKAVVAVV
jgi:hypothetical protein